MTELSIRNTTIQDIAGVVSLQRACFPAPFPEELLFNASHIQSHLNLFPEGQFVAVVEKQVVASITNLLVSLDDWNAHLPLEEISGGLGIQKHNPNGIVLYGIDISVHPSFRGQGLAKELYQKRFGLVRQLKLQRYGTVCRVPDFLKSRINSVPEYVQAVIQGQVTDRTLTPLLKVGVKFQTVIEDYLDDPESGNSGIVLEWTP